MASVTKNTVNLLKAYIFQKLVALFYFILLSRYLGPSNLGKYTFALYFIAVFSTLMDFGTSAVLTREISRQHEKTKKYINATISFKVLGGIFIYFTAFLLINFLHYPSATKHLVYLVGIVMILDSFSSTLYQAFRAHFNLKYESIGIIFQRTIILISGILLINLKAPLVLMVLPLIFGSIFYFLNALIFVRKKFNFWPYPDFNFLITKRILKISASFFIIAILIQLFMTINTLLLSKFAGDKFVGYYSAAERIPVGLVGLFASALSISVYPVFSRFFVEDKEKLAPLLQKSIIYLFTFGSALAIILFFLAEPIILVIYKSAYLPSAVVLKILSICLPFMYLNNILTVFLNACDRQRMNIFSYIAGLTSLIIVNIFLIPILKQNGSAIALLVAYVVLFTFQFYYVKNFVNLSKGYLSRKVGTIVLSALLSIFLIYFLVHRINVILAVLFGIIFYTILLYLFKIFKKEEIISIKNSISLKF